MLVHYSSVVYTLKESSANIELCDNGACLETVVVSLSLSLSLSPLNLSLRTHAHKPIQQTNNRHGPHCMGKLPPSHLRSSRRNYPRTHVDSPRLPPSLLQPSNKNHPRSDVLHHRHFRLGKEWTAGRGCRKGGGIVAGYGGVEREGICRVRTGDRCSECCFERLG